MRRRSSLDEQVAELERALVRTEGLLAGAQREYERLAERRNALVRVARLLKAEGLDPREGLTWASVCGARGWVTAGGAHRTVKRRDPRLHILLHQATMGKSCTLDRATYPLE